MFDFLTKYLERKIEAAVSKQVKAELELLPTELCFKLRSFNENVGLLAHDVKKLRSKTFKAQGIEKILFHKDYLDEDKQRLSDIAHTQLGLNTYWIGRLSHPVTISMEKRAVFRVNSNCLVCLLGLKFIDGDGWGKYQIHKGTEIVKEYSKSRLIKEEGIITNSLIYYPDEIMIFKQISGGGEVQIELLGMKLTPLRGFNPVTEIDY
jgi:hypothetical protein